MWNWLFIANKLQIPYGIDKWLQINKFHMELIIIVNELQIPCEIDNLLKNWLQIWKELIVYCK